LLLEFALLGHFTQEPLAFSAGGLRRDFFKRFLWRAFFVMLYADS
jgi:hypothetical protein